MGESFVTWLGAARLLAAVGLGLGLLRLVYLRRVGVRISEGGLVRVRVRATVTTIRKVSVKASRTNLLLACCWPSAPSAAAVGSQGGHCEMSRANQPHLSRRACREGAGRVQGH